MKYYNYKKSWVTLFMSALSWKRYAWISTLSIHTHVLVDHSLPRWIVDSRATKHVAREWVKHVDYRRIPIGRHYVTLSNEIRKNVLGVRTFQFKLCLGWMVVLLDVLYAPSVQCNLVFGYILKLGFLFICWAEAWILFE